jgi:hypothetical protein
VYAALAAPWGSAATDRRQQRLAEALDKLTAVFLVDPSRAEFQDNYEFNLVHIDPKTQKADVPAVWMDRSFCPLLLKALTAAVPKLRPRMARTDADVERLWAVLDARRSTVASPLWDERADGYSIYYTERCIEAVVKLSQYADNPIVAEPRIQVPEQRGSVVGDFVPLLIQVPSAELQAIVGDSSLGNGPKPKSARVDLDSVTQWLLDGANQMLTTGCLTEKEQALKDDMASIGGKWQKGLPTPVVFARLVCTLDNYYDRVDLEKCAQPKPVKRGKATRT